MSQSPSEALSMVDTSLKDASKSQMQEGISSEEAMSSSDQFMIPPYPSPNYISLLLPEEISEAVQAYLYAVTLFLQLDKDNFTFASDVSSGPGSQMVEFLLAYVNQRAIDVPPLSSPSLDEKIFNLIFRFVSEGRNVAAWIDWRFVIGVSCGWYESHQVELSTLVIRLWRRAKAKLVQEFSHVRDLYTESLEAIILDDTSDIVPTLTGLRYLVSLSDDFVDILVATDGAFLTALHDHYIVYRADLTDSERKAILYLFYTIIVSLAYRTSESSIGQNKKGKGTAGSTETFFFLLFEKLFGEYMRGERFDTFIADINQDTPFVEIMTDWTREWKGADEAIEGLTLYLDRSKAEAPQAEHIDEEIQRTSLISQVVDILPHLGEGFVEACLSAYDWDVERTIAAILNDDLPPELATMNRSKKRTVPPSSEAPPTQNIEYTSSQRRNVFDNDAFDLKQVDPSQVHRGRRERGTAADILDDKRFIRSQKAKIIHAVETQYDEYEDEYDDTYDDPERAIAHPANPRLKMIRDDVDEETTSSETDEEVEAVVYRWFKKSPDAFEKTARKTKDRDLLKQETKWTDEQIEGWKRMTERDPSILQKLEQKYENQVFQQTDLPSTAWRASVNEHEEEQSLAGRGGHQERGTRGHSNSIASRGHGRGRSRGRSRGTERGRARKDRIRNEFRPDA